MATGLNTEEMITKLIKVERTRVDKAEQRKQLLEWQRDSYREVSNMLRVFKGDYFDYLKPDTNFRSSAMFSSFAASVTLAGASTTYATATAGATASAGTHRLNNITLAKNDVWKSSSEVVSTMTGGTIDAAMLAKLTEGKSFTLEVDGVAKTITLDASYGTTTALKDGLNTLINNAFGIPGMVTESAGKLSFGATGHTIRLTSAAHTYASTLGFSSGASNVLTGSEITFPATIAGQFKINDTTVNVNVTAANIGELTSSLQSSVDAALGANVLKVANDGNKLKLVSYDTNTQYTLAAGDADNIIGSLGLTAGTSVAKLSGTPNLTVSDIGKELDIFVDGTQYQIDLTADYADTASLAAAINGQLAASGINVQDDGSGNLVFANTGGKEVRVADSTESIVDELGFTAGDQSSLDTSKTLEQVFGTAAGGSFTINGTAFTYTKDDTIGAIMSRINSGNLGVTLSYSELDNKFVLQSKEGGFSNRVSFSGSLMTNEFKLTDNTQTGSDASFTLDGIATTRSSNNFTIDGITYNLKSDYAAAEDIRIEVKTDSTKLMDTIKSFVSKYNEIIDKISGKVTEKRDRNYQPLTDEQREAMDEKEIELWESRAKAGILRSDSLLSGISSAMRNAMYDGVADVNIRLFSIGITTSSSYSDNGKLVIDETKLAKAIEDNPTAVSDLFTKTSDAADRSTRFSEQGLAHKLYDVIEDYIRTTRDSSGNKGMLLEKAGVAGDVSDYNNYLNKQIRDYDTRIATLTEMLADKENYYYNMFARMETAIQQMNSQSSWLSQQSS